MDNKVTFGLCNAVYSIITRQDNSISFGTPKKLLNAQSFEASIIGGKTDIYADNQVITTVSAYSGQDITLSLTEIPDDFKKDCLGYKVANSGELVEVTNAKPVEFALGIQIDGDAKNRRIWYYSCTATPVAESSSTKTDSVDVNTPQIAITAKPVEVNDYKVLRGILSVGDDGYDTYLSAAPTLPEMPLAV